MKKSADKLDIVRVKIAAIREINSTVRLYMTECKMLGNQPGENFYKTLKGDRLKLHTSVMKTLAGC